ncbi:5'/3'-nucleotidase SurE [Sulfurospirillum deleyianum]|uniref:5'-nucleotidase SurE n=1 Tax=Sulfurospirillum deleyianum (strain ATCC 51133 / DSM 6946 / 5175) TaxID=525898 RepID=D1B0B8_SULD5|nr:5'/3'-nucleotidase SurE [Sulfurospirillum deleyianum]ACZ11237.1 stationary-phase survival protein SurE [Sulfurospirillum deleyianum DSM 6946]
MKRILITNDDGFESAGLHALARALRPLGHVTIVAPSSEKSACGHSLTLTRPLRFISLEDDFFKLDDGTPTDCIYLSLNALFEGSNKPDLIVSGINKGSNLGEDITYSGTASAAMEGALHGIPSIAISQVYVGGPQNIELTHGYDLAEKTVHDLAKKILEGTFPLSERRFLNINIPPLTPDECKGYKITRAGYRMYGNDAHLHRNPRGEEYYWLGVHTLEWRKSEKKDCDLSAIEAGYVSITPIQLDMTAHDELETLNHWIEHG